MEMSFFPILVDQKLTPAQPTGTTVMLSTLVITRCIERIWDKIGKLQLTIYDARGYRLV